MTNLIVAAVFLALAVFAYKIGDLVGVVVMASFAVLAGMRD